MKARIIVAVIGAILILSLVKLGGVFFLAGLAFLTLASAFELIKMFEKNDASPLTWLIVAVNILFLFAALNNWFFRALLVFAFAFYLAFTFFVFNFPKTKIQDLMATLFIIIYTGWTFAHIMLLRMQPRGELYVYLLLTIIWATDSGAFFLGSALGGKKLATTLSPKKTISGAVGGIITALLFAMLFNWHFALIPPLMGVLLITIVSVAGQIGDLLESGIKRVMEVKDSGNALPGHGGFLDRFDSMLFAAPLLYYFLFFVANIK